jgi:hypothetical protein
MKNFILQIAAVGAAITAFLPSVASAQDVAPPPPAQPTVVQPVVETPAVIEPAAPAGGETTTEQAIGPSMAMVGTGVGIFALSYVPAVVIAAESNLDADKRLYVPIVGPWLDLGQRPSCSASDCNSESAAKVGIVIDGVFQAVGVLTVIGGLLTPAHETRTVRTAALKPTLHLTPATMGHGGYGMAALGTF